MGSLTIVPSQRPRPLPPATNVSSAPTRSPIEVTLDALEGRYRPLIVWSLFWGARPFSQLMRQITGITSKTLRSELAGMEKLGLVRREVRFGGNRKAEYSLTPLGQTLKPLLGVMYEWGLGRMKVAGRVRFVSPGAGSSHP